MERYKSKGIKPGKRRPETLLRNGHVNPILDPEVPEDTVREYLLDPRIYGRSRPEHSVSRNAQKKLRFN